MNSIQAHDAIGTAFGRVAPDVDVDTLAGDERFRSAADLDSLDFLALIENLHKLTGVDIPESDYPLVDTLNGLAAYLIAHAN